PRSTCARRHWRWATRWSRRPNHRTCLSEASPAAGPCAHALAWGVTAAGVVRVAHADQQRVLVPAQRRRIPARAQHGARRLCGEFVAIVAGMKSLGYRTALLR